MPTFLCIFNAILTLKSRKININIYKSKIKSQKFEKINMPWTTLDSILKRGIAKIREKHIDNHEKSYIL